MARPKKDKLISGEVPKPDFDHADRIFINDIQPANSAQKREMKAAGDGWKQVKIEAYVNVAGARAAYKVVAMDEVEQQAWLRSFAGVLNKKNVVLHRDLADMAEGVDDMPIVAMGDAPATPMPELTH